MKFDTFLVDHLRAFVREFESNQIICKIDH